MHTSNNGFTLVEIMIVIMIVGLLAAIAAPMFSRSRDSAQRTACLNNLRQIESAKDQWAIATGKASGDALDESEVDTYIRKGRPDCPTKGTYTYGPVGSLPTCSLGISLGHQL